MRLPSHRDHTVRTYLTPVACVPGGTGTQVATTGRLRPACWGTVVLPAGAAAHEPPDSPQATGGGALWTEPAAVRQAGRRPHPLALTAGEPPTKVRGASAEPGPPFPHLLNCPLHQPPEETVRVRGQVPWHHRPCSQGTQLSLQGLLLPRSPWEGRLGSSLGLSLPLPPGD